MKLPKDLTEQERDFIENYITEKEVTDMGKEEKEEQEDSKEDSAANMDAKYVRLQENTDDPDPEIMEADRKHVDMDEEKKGDKEDEEDEDEDDDEEDEKEAGNMAAKTPNKKKKGDMNEIKGLITSLKADFEAKLEKQEEKLDFLQEENKKLRAEKIAEKEAIRNDLIEDMEVKYRVPKNWLQEKAEKYGKKDDFIQDLYEGLSYAFGPLPGHEVKTPKEDMDEQRLVTKVSGLGAM